MRLGSRRRQGPPPAPHCPLIHHPRAICYLLVPCPASKQTAEAAAYLPLSILIVRVTTTAMESSFPSKFISPSGLSISELPRLMARTPTGAARDSSSVSLSAKPTITAKPRSTRAERACYSCHKRKIRCDVVKTSPCSNCKVDKLEVSAYPPSLVDHMRRHVIGKRDN